MKFAEILIQKNLGKDLDRLTYSIPENLEIKKGMLVSIPLRKKITTGIIWQIISEKPTFKTENIQEILIDKPLLSENQLELLDWISKYYICSLSKILKLFIPQRIFSNKPLRKIKEKTPEQITRTELKILTKHQGQIYSIITTSNENKFLIHGITGSGKTEVYTQITKHYLDQEKQVLILVPEISLTPQTIEYFEKRLGVRPTVINSKISEGERMKAWKNIWENKSKLIIGSRSSIFSPFQDLAAIIIDEEHDNSYKQENSPRYNTHQIAEKIIEIKPQIKLILGSATPNTETIEKYKDSTFNLNERIGNSKLPTIEIVDLREEFKKKNNSIFSELLKSEMQKTLDNKEQIILFLNRRGTASSIVCRDCGYTEKCKKCDTAMTYHNKSSSEYRLICHHCGSINPPPSNCKNCRGLNIRYLGIGTEKIEKELEKEFPQAKILRADKDTTGSKTAFEEIYKKFRNHEANILVGTQMIAKGLHLPNVSLVGVILADIGLNIPDFKTNERNFQLLTQVAGRAGRSNKPGKVIIQTYNPEHISLICTKEQNFEKFINYERTQRKLLKNPPFSKLAKIIIENPQLKNCKETANEIESLLWKFAREKDIAEKVEINLYPAYIPKLKNKFRYIILIKTLEELTPHFLLEFLPKDYIISPQIKIDIDPISIT